MASLSSGRSSTEGDPCCIASFAGDTGDRRDLRAVSGVRLLFLGDLEARLARKNIETRVGSMGRSWERGLDSGLCDDDIVHNFSWSFCVQVRLSSFLRDEQTFCSGMGEAQCSRPLQDCSIMVQGPLKLSATLDFRLQSCIFGYPRRGGVEIDISHY